jgi:hypothetical protein
MVRRREDMTIQINRYVCGIPIYNLAQEGTAIPAPDTGVIIEHVFSGHYKNNNRTCLVKSRDEYSNQKRLKLTLEDLLWNWR